MSLSSITHSKEFIERWREVLIGFYGYDEYMEFLIVPSIWYGKTLSYLPLLNYTDREKNNIFDLLELAKDTDFQIRVLNFDYCNYKENDTVTMRLDIDSKDSNQIFAESIKSRCRNKIRNSIKKNDFKLQKGNSNNLIDDFYTIFSKTMHNHGTPVFDKELFYQIRDIFQDEVIFYLVYDNNRPIATMCILLDRDIVWYPWGGVDMLYSKQLVGYFIYWRVLEDIVDNYDKKIFDFGRSSYMGSTYRFKSQFGANPVKIDILNSKENNVYSKYSLASTIWKKLPKRVADSVGSKLCKYLVDL